jgi:LuxR family maltose regulon positive regulatory protein
VLLRSWAAELSEPVAWVTVDRDERDAQRFWLHVIDALADAAPDGVVERVAPAPSFAGAATVTRLTEQLERLGEPVSLVIDDLHELKSDDALGWLDLLLAHLPETLRVVIGTREEPTLALHRLRLTGELVELRADDLRFSLDDTQALLAASDIALSDAGIESLYDRTEGWPAGLRLAVISLATHPDPERFVSEFSGSERTVAGYLLAEVLERQPPEVRELLLRTSTLERVNGELADALTGGSGGEAILQRLESQNAFVTSLDAGRTWFRYHHLFADLLRLELRRTTPATIPSLHRTAAAWFEQHRDVVAAIRHAQAADDWAHAGRLLVDNYLALTMAGRSETVHALLSSFPADADRRDADIALVLAADSIVHGLAERAASELAIAQSVVAATPTASPLYDVYAAVVGLELARRRGDLPAAERLMTELEASLAASPGADARPVPPAYRALALMNLGIAELWAGRSDAAREHLEDALTNARQIPLPFIEVGCLAHLAIAAPLTGQPLPRAIELAEHAVAIAEEQGWASEPMTTGAFAAAGLGHAWLARFEEAERYLDRADEALRAAGDPGTAVVLHHARGLLRFAQGRLDEAAGDLAHARGLARLLAGGHMLAVDVLCVSLQLQVRRGNTDAARAELEQLDAPTRDRAGMRIAEASLKLADEEPEAAADLLAPVIADSAEAVYRRGAQVEALLLDATAHDRVGDRGAAERSLETALDLAEPEGLLLPFALWAEPELIERHPRHRSAHGALLTTIADLLAGNAGVRAPATPLRDELSEAELRVVRYLPSNLSAVEIASELYVSANTVRTHMRHIYAKLDAHSRSEAVARARDLGLIAPGAATSSRLRTR